jgi:multidrug efflux pump subunit AcrA (membrane-fusion protein)
MIESPWEMYTSRNQAEEQSKALRPALRSGLAQTPTMMTKRRDEMMGDPGQMSGFWDSIVGGVFDELGIGYTKEEQARDQFNRQSRAYQEQQQAELARIRLEQEAARAQQEAALAQSRISLERTKILVIGAAALIGGIVIFYALKED